MGDILHSIRKDWHPFFDKEGNKISMLTHARLSEDDDYRIVKQEQVGDKHWVSTVWTGVEAWTSRPRPLVFETMVFSGDRKSDPFRWATEQEARDSHEKIVQFLETGGRIEKIRDFLVGEEDFKR